MRKHASTMDLGDLAGRWLAKQIKQKSTHKSFKPTATDSNDSKPDEPLTWASTRLPWSSHQDDPLKTPHAAPANPAITAKTRTCTIDHPIPVPARRSARKSRVIHRNVVPNTKKPNATQFLNTNISIHPLSRSHVQTGVRARSWGGPFVPTSRGPAPGGEPGPSFGDRARQGGDPAIMAGLPPGLDDPNRLRGSAPGRLSDAARTHQLPDLPRVSGGPGSLGAQHVHVAGRVLAEPEDEVIDPACGAGRDAQLLDLPEPPLPGLGHQERAVRVPERRAPVTEDVPTPQLGERRGSVDEPAHDHEPYPARLAAVRVLDHRVDEGVSGARPGQHLVGALLRRLPVVLGVEAVGALLDVPSEVRAARDEADLLPQPLAGVRHEQVAGLYVEGHAVGVAEPVGPDLVEPGRSDERVVGGDAVGVAAVYVDPQDVAEQVLLDVLPVAAAVVGVPVLHVAQPDVVRASPVAEGDVQVAIGTEGQGAGVVVELRFVDLEQDPLRGGLDPIRISRHRELGDVAGGVEARPAPLPPRSAVVDEEPSVGRVVGMEREPEQAALVEARLERDHPVADVQERLGEQHPAGGDDPDQARLIHHEQPTRSIGSLHEGHGRGQAVGDELEIHVHRVADRGLSPRGGRGESGQQERQQRSHRDEASGSHGSSSPRWAVSDRGSGPESAGLGSPPLLPGGRRGTEATGVGAGSRSPRVPSYVRACASFRCRRPRRTAASAAGSQKYYSDPGPTVRGFGGEMPGYRRPGALARTPGRLGSLALLAP